MRRNQKLTKVIGARTVERATAERGKLVIKFDDQSTLRVEAAGIADMAPPRGRIKATLEDGIQFTLQFEDGSTVTLQLADQHRWCGISRTRRIPRLKDLSNHIEACGTA